MKYSDFLFWMFMVFIMIALSNTGCSETRSIDRMTRKDCVTDLHKKQLADFILKCAEAANPKSDEEGEDLVIQCERTGINTLCPATESCRDVIDKGGLQGYVYGSWEPCK